MSAGQSDDRDVCETKAVSDIHTAMLRIYLLGQLRVLNGKIPLTFAGRPKLLPLWAYLLLYRHQPLPRETVAFALWPDEPEAAARANLRRHLYHLQRTLPPAQPGRPWVISAANHIQWNPDAPYTLDVADFERLSQSDETLAQAIACYRGDLLEQVYEDWILYERERLRDLYLACLTRIALRLRSGQRYPEALQYAQELLRLDPLREDTLRQLLALRYEMGDRAGALAEYERFAQRLHEELAVEPMPETVALYQRIAGHQPLPGAPLAADRPMLQAGRLFRFSLPFVGHEAELEQLRVWVNRAAQGRGALTLIGGETGIGKSRLVDELTSHAELQAMRIMKGQTTSPEAHPYQAVLEGLRAALTDLAALALPQIWLAVLATLLPELHGLRPDLSPPAPLDPDRDRARLFEALARSFERLAREQPLLLILEDLHWASSATIGLLEVLARHVSSCGLLILATYRAEEVARAHPLRAMRRRLQRESLVSHVTLGRLPRPAVDTLVARLFGSNPEAVSLSERLIAESEGNPLLIRELLYDWIDSGRIALVEGRWEVGELAAALPGSVRDTIAGRFGRLPANARALAEIAAVIGPSFDVELVREVSGWDEAYVLDTLHELLDRHLVREAGGGGDFDYAFTHHLIQATIYDSADGGARKRRHRRVAEVMEDLYADRIDEVASALALHCDRDTRPEAAAGYYLRAARRMAAVYADEEALAALARALDLSADQRLRFELLALREEIARRRGERASQRHDLEQLGQLAQALGDQDALCEVLRRTIDLEQALGNRAAAAGLIAALAALADAIDSRRWRAEALLSEATAAILAGHFDQARRRLEPALELYAALNDQANLVRCHCLMAETVTYQGSFAMVRFHLEQARQLAEAQANYALLLPVLGSAARSALLQQDSAAAEAFARQMLELAELIGDREAEADASHYLGVIAARRYQLAEAHRLYGRAEELFHALGKPQGLGAVLLNAGTLALRVGRLADGVAAFRQANQLFQQLNDLRGQTLSAINLGMAALLAGDYAVSLAASQQSLELARTMGSVVYESVALANMGTAERELGLLDQAIEHIEAGIALRRQVGGQHDNLANDLYDLAVAYLRAGLLQQARATADELLAIYHSAADSLTNPQYALWAAAQTERALGAQARAEQLRDQAYAAMQGRTGAIPDAESRAAFQNLPYNRQIRAAYEQGIWP